MVERSILCSGRPLPAQHKIRLAGIDAPEKAQPFGQRSKQHLAEFAFGKDAKADCYKVDRYDRDVCTVYVNGQDVGPAQLDADSPGGSGECFAFPKRPVVGTPIIEAVRCEDSSKLGSRNCFRIYERSLARICSDRRTRWGRASAPLAVSYSCSRRSMVLRLGLYLHHPSA
jgi:hypothetical protein